MPSVLRIRARFADPDGLTRYTLTPRAEFRDSIAGPDNWLSKRLEATRWRKLL